MVRWTEEEYLNYLGKKAPKKNKYRNQKTTVDGITFDSKKEVDYYCMLKIFKQEGKIRDFGLQPRHELQTAFEKNGVKYRVITYIADL